MVSESVYRFALQIQLLEINQFTTLELQECLFHAQLGLDRRTIERYLKEAYFEHVIIPTAWKVGRGHRDVDKTVLLNVARWKRGIAFDDVVNNGVEAHARPAHA